MITVREVSSKRDQKEFLDFPLRLYKNEPNFVPPLYGDEKKIFREDYIYYDTSEAVYYIAEENGETVGRISGILQKASNEKRGEKRIRFTRFDAVNRQEVADALFAAVEDWGRAKGMTEICGPLGFSDLEREGLLVEGFEYLATFEEQYNYAYYGKLIENCGYAKEVDWTESRIKPDPASIEQMDRVAEKLMERFWPGPMTIIFNKKDIVPDATTGGLGTVAIRMPSHPDAKRLIDESKVFIAAPSANTSGRPSPSTADHVIEDLSGRIDMILDGGAVDIGIESSIIDMTGEIPAIPQT